MVNITGKVALITGASSGIGRATAVHFASLGCSVAINGRNADKLNRTLSQCVAAGLPQDRVLIVLGDVGKEEDATKIVDDAVNHFGQLDILVNNAGVLGFCSLENTTTAELDRILNTNVKGAFLMVKLSAPHLKKTRGSVVNVSSVVSHRVFERNHAYSLSKAALDHLTKTVALELAPEVRVNSVNPAYVLTDIITNMNATSEQSERLFEEGKKLHALGRYATPDEIAKPIAFLASEDASFVTGSIFLVDGGFSLMANK